MLVHRYMLLGVLFALTGLSVSAADDPYGDPIPAGARARLGTARMRSIYGGPTVLTPDGKYFVGQEPDRMSYYEPATGKVARTVRVEAQFSTLIAFSADGKRAVNTSYDSTFVWNTESGKVLATVKRFGPGGDAGVSISADGKRLALGGSRRDKEMGTSAIVWDVDGNKALVTVTPAQNETVYVAISPDGKRLATWGSHFDRSAKEQPRAEADPARHVQFWDTESGRETAKVFVPSGHGLMAAAFSPDGSLAAVSAGEGAVYLFDPASGAAKGVLLGRARQGRKLAFNPAGKTLASIGDDGGIQRWAVVEGTRLGTTEPPVPIAQGVRGLVFADNERVIAWTMRGLTATAWEAPSGKLLTPAGGHAGPIQSLAISGDNKEILTSSSDGTILRWDAATGMELGSIRLKPPGAAGFGLSPSATLAPTGARALVPESGGLAIYDLPAGTQAFVIPGDTVRESRGAFTADGAKVIQVLGSYDLKKNPARVVMWDVVAARKLGEIELPGFGFPQAVLTADGKTLVTAGVKQDADSVNAPFVVAAWEVASGKKRAEFTEAGGFGPGFIAAAMDNTSVVAMLPRGGAALIDVAAGTKTRDLELGQRGQAAAAPAVSPDGKTAAVLLGGGYGPNPTSTVVLVDLGTGKARKTLNGISGSPSTALFSVDGKTLITGSSVTTALVWDVAK
jgi:WD40 repeat protein